jgi:hypothetical protein
MLSRDFKEFVGLLNARGVEYLVVGGYAMALHGRPRHTGDLDIWIRRSPENAARLMGVLRDSDLATWGLCSRISSFPRTWCNSAIRRSASTC